MDGGADFHVTAARECDLADLAAVAAATFPLACPPSAAPADISAFIAANLSEQRFAEYRTDPERVVLTAAHAGRIIGYAMLIRGVGDDPAVADDVRQRPAVELSKMYVLPDYHRTGAAAASRRGTTNQWWLCTRTTRGRLLCSLALHLAVRAQPVPRRSRPQRSLRTGGPMKIATLGD